MKYGKRIVVSALAVVLVLSCAGCDLGMLVSNSDAVQAGITQRLDMLIGTAADWMLYVDGLLARLPTP